MEKFNITNSIGIKVLTILKLSFWWMANIFYGKNLRKTWEFPLLMKTQL